MTNVFLDTSALIKLYHRETDSLAFRNYLNSIRIQIVLAPVAPIEFTSAIRKKERGREITKKEAERVLNKFHLQDLPKHTVVPFEDEDTQRTVDLINECGSLSGKGAALRTLDAIQLNAALKARSLIDVFISSTKSHHPRGALRIADQNLARIARFSTPIS